MVKEYFLQNWPLLLILLAFVISLLSTVFMDKKTILRYYILIAAVFLLSIVVFVEFYLYEQAEYRDVRIILMAIRYSATPLIMAQIIFTLVKHFRWFVFIPALALIILNVVSISTGIVFSIADDNITLVHGPLGIIPFVMVGLYGVLLVYLLVKHSSKRLMEIIYIAFFAFTLASGLVFVAIYGKKYAAIFCVTIAIALFAYFEFTVLQLTKKDSLTGLFNRHAYFSDINRDFKKSITAIISIDMNGLKAINDAEGHQAGDDALVILSQCFMKPLKRKQLGYRIGGDEFVIVCRKTPEDEVLDIVDRIRKGVAETKYSVSIGYGINTDGSKSVNDLLKESDERMYLEKEKYYQESGENRR